MSIAEELEKMEGYINETYDTIEEKGGETPEVRSLGNLVATVDENVGLALSDPQRGSWAEWATSPAITIHGPSISDLRVAFTGTPYYHDSTVWDDLIGSDGKYHMKFSVAVDDGEAEAIDIPMVRISNNIDFETGKEQCLELLTDIDWSLIDDESMWTKTETAPTQYSKGTYTWTITDAPTTATPDNQQGYWTATWSGQSNITFDVAGGRGDGCVSMEGCQRQIQSGKITFSIYQDQPLTFNDIITEAKRINLQFSSQFYDNNGNVMVLEEFDLPTAITSWYANKEWGENNVLTIDDSLAAHFSTYSPAFQFDVFAVNNSYMTVTDYYVSTFTYRDWDAGGEEKTGYLLVPNGETPPDIHMM